LSITPNLVENTITDASFPEFVNELGVDTAGFIASELVGDLVQTGSAEVVSPWLSVPFGVYVDYRVGRLWDLIWYGDK